MKRLGLASRQVRRVVALGRAIGSVACRGDVALAPADQVLRSTSGVVAGCVRAPLVTAHAILSLAEYPRRRFRAALI